MIKSPKNGSIAIKATSSHFFIAEDCFAACTYSVRDYLVSLSVLLTPKIYHHFTMDRLISQFHLTRFS